MTPILQAVYDELLELASRDPYAERAAALRERFAERTGRFEPEHPLAAVRQAAAWEDALVRGGLAGELVGALADPSEREIARALPRAQRGVFVFVEYSGNLIARDLWSGAELVVLSRDDVGRELALSQAESPLCQARLLAGRDGCAVLPGTVFHPIEARPAVEDVLARARERELTTDAVLDALLRMEHAWQTLSRVKVRYAYRPEALGRSAQ